MLLSTFLFTWCIIFLVDVTDATYLGSYYTYHNEKAGHRVVRQADFQEFDAHGLLDNKTLLDMALASTIPPADYDVELDKEETEHLYYNMNIIPGNEDTFSKYYLDLSKNTTKNGTQKHEHLQDAYRKAAGIKLSFPFPFYGHRLYNVTIATGGFLYLGDQSHSWLAATQYIAPLMANFDTFNPDSHILYATSDDGERIVFEWFNVTLRDSRESGRFTFQVSLWKSGNITFVYKDIPNDVASISDSNHPCKIGISDAYFYSHKVTQSEKSQGSSPVQNKRVIHEYHRITVPPEKIKPYTVVHLTASPTCMNAQSCADCQKLQLKTFQCSWCMPKNTDSAFCTDQLGLNRRRQEFVENDCQSIQKDTYYCATSEGSGNVTALPAPTTSAIVTSKPDVLPSPSETVPPPLAVPIPSKSKSEEKEQGSGGPAFLTLFLVLGISVTIWMLYAYYNPHTPSGQLLIKYRPSKWHVPSSHVRYTASVHM